MAVLQAKITKVINPGHIDDDGKISILVAAGDTKIDLEFPPKLAQSIVDGLKGALKQAAKKTKT